MDVDENGAEVKEGDVLAVGHGADAKDLRAVWSPALRSLIMGLGDLSHVHIVGDLTTALDNLDARLHALEDAATTAPPPPTSEGWVEIDNYGGGFVRARVTTAGLEDAAEHWTEWRLAATPGPNGALIASADALTAMNGATWYDHGGTLGKVVGQNGQDIGNVAVANYIRQHRLVKVKTDLTTDPGHPRLVVLDTYTPNVGA
jgi:hypothetical protein